jgi:C_GCAxxG_C_C family probable redox protein
MKPLPTTKNDTKQVFRQCGTCSRTFFHLLNREFGYNKDLEEKASDPLAGGIMQLGHQCGMLWGAAMAVGAEAFRQTDETDEAIGRAIQATQHLVKSFAERTQTVNCREITDTDFSKTIQMIKYMLFKAKDCFNLAEDWAPEAFEAAHKGLEAELTDLPAGPLSCASEVVRRMGGHKEQVVTVAGLAGGLGLSGHACGALSAAMWMKSIEWLEEHPNKRTSFFNPYAKETLKAFQEKTGGELLCEKLTGRKFESIEEHAAFIRDGGCEELMEVLTENDDLV